jgi:hypothetical protein
MNKKLILASCFFVASFALSIDTVKAQDGRRDAAQQSQTPEQRADNQLQRWTQALTLTPEQVNQIKPMLVNLNQKRAAIRDASDKRAAMKDMRDLVTAQDEKMKSILSTDQYTKYESIKDEAKDRMKGRGGRRD